MPNRSNRSTVSVSSRPANTPSASQHPSGGRCAVERLEERQLMAAAPPALVTKVPEAGAYKLVYDLNVPLLGGAYKTAAPAYAVNDTASVKTPIDRVAYHMELKRADGTTRWVFVSAGAFTQDLKKIGVPTTASGAVFQQRLSNMTVRSNAPGIVTGSGLAGGNIEFWPHAYGPANARAVPNASAYMYDHGDAILPSTDRYGSMQLHNSTAKQTLLAYNGFAGGDATKPAEVGIGNSPTGGTDWTFNRSANQWTVRRLQVLVRPAPVPIRPAPTPIPPKPVPPAGATFNFGRVMPLGDSITWGFSQNLPATGGYRSRLYGGLRSGGHTLQFVGSVRDTYSAYLKGVNQTAHEGHGGYRTDQLLGNLLGVASGTNVSSNNGGRWLNGTATRAAVYPDVILLHIGTNDIIQNRTVASAAANLDKIVQTLTTARPNAKLFVSSIIPHADPTKNVQVKLYNTRVWQVVAKYRGAGKKVHFVDQYKNFLDPQGRVVASTLPDKVHPTRAGYDRIGDTWAQAVLAVARGAK